jgi:hypothetical protein
MNVKPLIGIAVLGAGAYFLLNTQMAQAQPIGEAPSGNRGVMDGIGTGGGGAVITTASPTGTPTGGDTYNTVYNFESPNIDFSPATLDQQSQQTTTKKQKKQPTGYTSDTLQMSFGTLEAMQQAEAEASAKKKAISSPLLGGKTLKEQYPYFNFPKETEPTSGQGTTPATSDHQAPKKTATTPTGTINTAQAQAISLIPTAVINPMGAVAQASGYAMGNWVNSIFGGR